ncbi:MAG: SMP-30/gluconolactonase/LRE family protein [Verrucomicrobiia bacterium]
MKSNNLTKVLVAVLPVVLVFSILGTVIAAEVETRFLIKNDEVFKKLISADAKLEKLAGGLRFTEGPVWVSAGGDGYLIFSDIPANQLKKWSKIGGLVTFREPSNNANGNTVDREGRLVTAEHSGRRISMTERDGTVKTVVDLYRGKKLNSPNDVVVKSDGTIWFTDPPYGIKPEEKEQDGNYVFCYDPRKKELRVVAADFDRPNGLCFSPDEKLLYIADSGKPRHIRVFDVEADNILKNGRVFCRIDVGGPDGIRCDSLGNIWSSAGDGVHIFSTNGELVGKILVPETPANLCFGGEDGKTLFITARASLYCIKTLVKSAVK